MKSKVFLMVNKSQFYSTDQHDGHSRHRHRETSCPLRASRLRSTSGRGSRSSRLDRSNRSGNRRPDRRRPRHGRRDRVYLAQVRSLAKHLPLLRAGAGRRIVGQVYEGSGPGPVLRDSLVLRNLGIFDSRRNRYCSVQSKS